MENHYLRKKGLYSAILLALGMGAIPAHAAEFIVNSIADGGDSTPGDGQCKTSDGKCTLRAAVEEANAHDGADAITLPAGTYLLGTPLVVTATETTTIQGNSRDDTTISGGGLGQLFSVSAGGKLTATRVRLTRGNDANGAILRNFGTATLDDVRVDNSSGNLQRAIVNESNATLTIRNSELSGNNGGQAGIANRGGTVTIESSTLRDFRANSNDTSEAAAEQNSGGALISRGGSVTVTGSTFTHNHATAHGGALAILGAVSITNSSFQDNRAELNGGALALGPSAPTDTTSEARITGSAFTGNAANKAGGAIATANRTTIEDSRIENNQALEKGGGLFQYFDKDREVGDGPPLTVRRTAVRNNRTTLPDTSTSGHGGGLYLGDKATIDHSEISGNQANKGGAVFVAGQANTIQDSTISGNTASQNGGGLYLLGTRQPPDPEGAKAARLTLTHVTLVRNGAGNGSPAGGNVWFVPGAKASVFNSIVDLPAAGGNCTQGIPNGSEVVGSGHAAIEAQAGNFTSNGCGAGQANTNLNLDTTLKDNGGPTRTHALLPGSAAIDAGDAGHCTDTDQRGKPRGPSGNCDVGAFERQADDGTGSGGSGGSGSGSGGSGSGGSGSGGSGSGGSGSGGSGSGGSGSGGSGSGGSGSGGSGSGGSGSGGSGSGGSGSGSNGSGNGTGVLGESGQKDGPARTGGGPLGPWMLLLAGLLGWRRLRR